MADMSPQDFTPSADDLMSRMQSLAPPRGAAPSDSIPTMTVRPSNSAPSVDDLVARMNTIAPPSESTQAAASTERSPYDTPPDLPMHPPIARILQAGVQGYTDTQPIFTPKMQDMVDQGPVGRYITNPLFHAMGAIPAGFNALAAAGGQAITEGAQAAGQPALGRDINMLAQVAPIVMGGAPGVPLTRGGLVARDMQVPQAPRFIGERTGEVTPADTVAAPLPQGFRDNALAPSMVNRLAQPQQDNVPTMTIRAGDGAPGAAGAQATPSAAGAISPEDAAIAQSQAEHNRYSERQTPGVADTAIKVPGVEPTNAQMEQTVNSAREIKKLNNLNVDVSQEDQAVADEHNGKRQDFFASIAGSIPDLANADKARGAKFEAAIGKAWEKKGTADASGIEDVGNKILNGPDGKRDLVVSEVNKVLSKLYDKNGDLETDPEQLYGVRKHINDRLSKEASVDDPLVARSQAALLTLRDAVDQAIEPAAPGFGKAIADFAADSRPIDVMEALQKAEPKLSDTNGRMQYSRVHNLMREIITARRPDAALSNWQSLTPEDMGKLWGLHDDLRRVAGAEELARAKGSDTAMNAVDIAKEYGKMAGSIIHGFPIVGPAIRGFQLAAQPVLSARAARNQLGRGINLLHPDRSGIQPPLP